MSVGYGLKLLFLLLWMFLKDFQMWQTLKDLGLVLIYFL